MAATTFRCICGYYMRLHWIRCDGPRRYDCRMFYGITDLTTFILGTIFIVLLPGPNSLYVMTVASRLGVGPGYRGACGIFVGDTILMVLSATGVASVLHATPALFMVVKYAG